MSKKRMVGSRILALAAVLAFGPSAQAFRVDSIDVDGNPVLLARRPLKYDSRPYARILETASVQTQIPLELLTAIVEVESHWNPLAVSKRGAMGLMQLMPETAKIYGVTNPFDPKQNINGGALYLKKLFALFQGEIGLVLSAYHAGHNRILQTKVVPSEGATTDYVRQVLSVYGQELNYRRASGKVSSNL